jgi:hypothetical protein
LKMELNTTYIISHCEILSALLLDGWLEPEQCIKFRNYNLDITVGIQRKCQIWSWVACLLKYDWPLHFLLHITVFLLPAPYIFLLCKCWEKQLFGIIQEEC